MFEIFMESCQFVFISQDIDYKLQAKLFLIDLKFPKYQNR